MALLDQSRLPCNPARRFGIGPAAFGWLAEAS